MPPDPSTEAELHDEAMRLLAAAEGEEIVTRLIGGMAIRLLAGERMHPAFERDVADLDFVVARGQSRPLAKLLESKGYAPNVEFNALNGARRMLFYDPGHERQVDVFVGSFEMCHSLPLTERLGIREHTLPGAELLMTKLQIVHLNEKDRLDALALLHALELGPMDRDEQGADRINVERIVSLTSHDWGLNRTFELNLERLGEALPSLRVGDEGRATIRDRLDRLASALAAAPKSRKWKLRGRVGERKRWYEEPEEVDR